MIIGIQKRQFVLLLVALSVPLLLNAVAIWQDVGKIVILQILRGTYGYSNPFPEIILGLPHAVFPLALLFWFIVYMSNRAFFQKQPLIAKLIEALLMAWLVALFFDTVTSFFMPFKWVFILHPTYNFPSSEFVSHWSHLLVLPTTFISLFIAIILSGIKAKDASPMRMIKHRRNYVLAIAASLIIVVSLYYFCSWAPSPEWDKSPQNLVIWIGDYSSYKPADVEIWGDGYIIWSKCLPDGNRKVFEGYLPQQEMTLLIQKLIGLNFFKRYKESEDHDGTSISVSLIDASRSEWIDPDNKQLFDFATYLKAGAGITSKELIPTKGILDVTPIERTSLPKDTKANFYWLDDKFGYGLDVFEKEISGDELKFAWEVVNSSMLPIVKSKGQIYLIDVMLPREYE